MRILTLTRYERLGSSSRVRFYQYFPYLRSHGVEITSAPFFNDDYVQSIYAGRAVSATSFLSAYGKRLLTVLRSSRYDLIWVEKELFPWLPAWFEKLLPATGSPYIVDYDDAVFHRYDLHKSSFVRFLLKHKIDRVMQRAAMVVAGNDYLANRAKKAGAKRIETLPSVVDVKSYTPRTGGISSPFRIGWIGSPVTAPYLSLVKEALTQLAREAEIHLVWIGAGDSTPFPNIPTTILSWDEKLERSIGELFDVGIMPLVDGPFERGKCGYKLVQYMAAGLPVIASPVGVNQQMVEPGVNGFLASSTQQWLDAFRSLLQHRSLAMDMGRASRQKAEQKYNLKGTAPKLLDLFTSMQKVKN
jgi:glycosyltransferase involved in cell wall biosynthesis